MADSTSPSQRIDERIEELGDWRGALLGRLRALVKDADPDVVEGWIPFAKVFDVVANGPRHVMMGATQVDQYGNQNIAAIGDPARPRPRLARPAPVGVATLLPASGGVAAGAGCGAAGVVRSTTCVATGAGAPAERCSSCSTRTRPNWSRGISPSARRAPRR